MRALFALLLLCSAAFAQTAVLPGFPPGLFDSRAALDASSGPPPATTTFDPSNLGTGVTLSGGNLIATQGVHAGAYALARSLTSHLTGKFYFELTINNNGGSGDQVVVGIVNALASINTYIGIDINGAGAFGTTPGWFENNSTGGRPTTPTYGTQTVGIAVDYGAGLIWLANITASPTTWNAGTGNPAAGTGGADISLIPCPCYAAAGLHADIGIQITANFGATAYAASAPSGFGNY